MLESAPGAINAEPKGLEGPAKGSTWRPRLGLGPADGSAFLLPVLRVCTFGGLKVVSLDVHEVAAGAEGADTHGLESAAGDIPAAVWLVVVGPLLAGAVDEQAAAAIVAVAASVVAPTQLCLVLGVVEGNVELVEPVGELAALGILAQTQRRVAGAQLGLVAGGADPRHAGNGGVYQREQRVGQGDTAAAALRLRACQQVVHHLLILARRQEGLVTHLIDKPTVSNPSVKVYIYLKQRVWQQFLGPQDGQQSVDPLFWVVGVGGREGDCTTKRTNFGQTQASELSMVLVEQLSSLCYLEEASSVLQEVPKSLQNLRSLLDGR